MNSIKFFLSGMVFALMVCASTPQIPVLPWQVQSDWINVKNLGAQGNGTNDDGPAIQKALDSLGKANGNGAIVAYIPSGTYRITKTLRISAENCLLLGCGRSTVIMWDGAADSTMLWTDGITGGMIQGITWRGNKKAAYGILHRAVERFECKVRHENQAFYDFTIAGIGTSPRAIWHSQQVKFATSETEVRNCLFVQCHIGVDVNFFNYYNWVVEGCEFNMCGIGVRCKDFGDARVRFCHFENSAQYDVSFEWSHGSSIRYCSSVGARRFAWMQANCIQNCVVEKVKDKDSAIVLNCPRGPFLVTDVFLRTMASKNPPIVFDAVSPHDSEYAPANLEPQKLVYSNIQNPGATGVYAGGDGRAHATQIPTTAYRQSPLFAATQSFLKQTDNEFVPHGKVFNVKTMGAKGDATTDDAAVIQKAVDEAKKAGKGAWVYFPAGVYVVNKPIQISGSDYFITGTGYNSRITSLGLSRGNSLFSVGTVNNVSIKNFMFVRDNGHPKRPNGVYALAQTGTTTGSSITYDRIWGDAFADNVGDRSNGLLFENLGSKDIVHIIRMVGALHVKNSGPATILVHFIDGQPIYLEGTAPNTGFTGILNANGGNVQVYDNHSLVLGDQYVERADKHLLPNQINTFLVQGDSASKPGRVTIRGDRFMTEMTDTMFRINNYKGIVSFWNTHICADSRGWKYVISQKGMNPVDIIFGALGYPSDKGVAYPNESPLFSVTPAATVAQIEIANCEKCAVPEGSLGKAALALDDFRRLGEVTLLLDFGLNMATKK